VSEKPNYRQERIERLLHELRYEIERGMMQGEIEEEMGFRFFVPVSKHFKHGVVQCEFRTRPSPYIPMMDPEGPRLKLVKSGTDNGSASASTQ
jgi:hypothetical protein